MVRAGTGGYVADDFARGQIAIGWNKIGDLTAAKTIDQVRNEYIRAYPDAKPGEVGNAVAMIHKFRSTLRIGDNVLSFYKARREYLVGEVTGDYAFKPGDVRDHPHVRTVAWVGQVSRDRLRVASRNTLGSVLTLFSVPEEVWADVSEVLRGQENVTQIPAEVIQEEREELEQTRQDTEARLLSSSTI
jgi:restriction system protein